MRTTMILALGALLSGCFDTTDVDCELLGTCDTDDTGVDDDGSDGDGDGSGSGSGGSGSGGSGGSGSGSDVGDHMSRMEDCFDDGGLAIGAEVDYTPPGTMLTLDYEKAEDYDDLGHHWFEYPTQSEVGDDYYVVFCLENVGEDDNYVRWNIDLGPDNWICMGNGDSADLIVDIFAMSAITEVWGNDTWDAEDGCSALNIR